MAETTEQTQPELVGNGLNPTSAMASLGWDKHPAQEAADKQAEELHMRASAPLVQTVMKAATPNATPEDRKAAADVFSKSNEVRIGDAIQAAINLNPAELYKAITGGSSVPEIGYDGANNQYEVMYNQRGERRSIRNLRTGKYLDEKELADTGGITTRLDTTPERQAGFKAAGITVGDYAKARSADFLNTKQAAGAGGVNGGMIEQLAMRNDALSKRLSPSSLDPKTLAFIRGISSIRTGDQQAIRSMTDAMNQAADGSKKSKDISEDVKRSAGLNLGLQYHEGKGWLNSNGEVATRDEINRLSSQLANESSSEKAIEARKQDMLEKAQTLAAGKSELLNDINELINNNAKIALAQNEIEKFGGIGVAKPNLPQQLGDSFMSARQKAISDQFYGASSQLFSNFVDQETKNLPPGRVPDIGELKKRFASSPEFKALQARAIEQSKLVEEENRKVAEEINKRSAIPVVNEPRAPATPAPAPQSARPPVQQETPKPKRSLRDIHNSLK